MPISQANLEKFKTLLEEKPQNKTKFPINTSEEVKKPEGSFVKSLIKGTISPFARLASNVANVGEGIYQITQGDWDKANEAVNKKRTFGLGLGEFESVGAKDSLKENIKDISGTGLELASTLLPAKGVSNIAKAGYKTVIKQGIKQGIKYGALTGAMQGIGGELQKEGSGVVSTLVNGGFGALTGGVLGGVIGGTSGALIKALKKTKFSEATKQAILKGDPEAVGYKLKGDKIIADIDAVTAVNRGFDPRHVNLIKNTLEDNGDIYRQLYKAAEKGNKTLSNLEMNNIKGEILTNKIKYILKQESKIGSQLDNEISKIPIKNQNITNIQKDFIKDLASQEISIGKKGILNFENSIYKNSPNEMRLIQNVFNEIKPKIAGSTWKTPQQIAKIRQIIFHDLDLANKTLKETTQAEGVILKLRDNLDDVLDGLSTKVGDKNITKYKDLSIKYAQIKNALGKFNQKMGRGFNIEKEISKTKSGEIMNRLLSNASSNTLDTIQDITDTALNLGMKSKYDARSITLFSDLLEDLFDITPTRSLQGQVEKGTSKAMQDTLRMGEQILRRDPNLFINLYNKAKGITPEAQKEIIKKLIGL